MTTGAPVAALLRRERQVADLVRTKGFGRPGAVLVWPEDCLPSLSQYFVLRRRGEAWLGRRVLAPRPFSIVRPQMVMGRLIGLHRHPSGVNFRYQACSDAARAELFHHPGETEVTFPFPVVDNGWREQVCPAALWDGHRPLVDGLDDAERHLRDHAAALAATMLGAAAPAATMPGPAAPAGTAPGGTAPGGTTLAATPLGGTMLGGTALGAAPLARTMPGGPPVVFDPACSTGACLRALADAVPNARCVGADRSPAMARRAAAMLPHVLVADAARPPLAPGGVDLLVVRFLNAEVVERAAARPIFRRLAGLLAPGGHAFVFGHTAVLLDAHRAARATGLRLRATTGAAPDGAGLFQFYVLGRSMRSCQTSR
jgi:Methyltransferase domain